MIVNLYKSESRLENADGTEVAARAECWSFYPIIPVKTSRSGVWWVVVDAAREPMLRVRVPVGSELRGEPGGRRLFGHFSRVGLDAFAVAYRAQRGDDVFSVVEPSGIAP